MKHYLVAMTIFAFPVYAGPALAFQPVERSEAGNSQFIVIEKGMELPAWRGSKDSETSHSSESVINREEWIPLPLSSIRMTDIPEIVHHDKNDEQNNSEVKIIYGMAGTDQKNLDNRPTFQSTTHTSVDSQKTASSFVPRGEIPEKLDIRELLQDDKLVDMIQHNIDTGNNLPPAFRGHGQRIDVRALRNDDRKLNAIQTILDSGQFNHFFKK